MLLVKCSALLYLSFPVFQEESGFFFWFVIYFLIDSREVYSVCIKVFFSTVAP